MNFKNINIEKHIIYISIVLLIFSSCTKSESNITTFSTSLKAGNRIFEDPNWYSWGVAPIYGDDGKVHALVCRWPSETGMKGWLSNSEIAHAVADKPEGPYEITGTIIGLKNDNDWDYVAYNPNIHKIGDEYVMVYSGRKKDDVDKIAQQIGMAFADSPNGPWIKKTTKPIIPYSGISGTWNSRHASNPSLVASPDGKFRIYYKGISDNEVPELRTIGVAISDNIEGPYIDYPENPVISYIEQKGDVEDPYAFYYDGKYFIIVEDRMGVARQGTRSVEPENQEAEAGGVRPGLIYTSKDGFNWGEPQIGYQTNDIYFDESRERFERPQILWKDGKPDYLFLALKGGKYKTSSNAILKIEDW